MANNELPLRPSPAIGIDLGTTYSCVAICDRDYPKIIINDQGNRTTPSYVSFTDEEIFAGDVAREYATMDPTNTIYAVKHLIGRRFSDPCVNKDNNLRPFTVVPSTDDKPQIVVQYRGKEKQFSAEEISAMILKKMKQIAENYLRCTVKDAVITVPAYFSDSQRRATKEAGILAGLNVKRLMDEPTAAALAYGYKNIKYYTKPQNVCVFDLGGGTFDVSLVHVSGDHFEIKATAGDTHLGGQDFDSRLLDYLIEEFKRKHKKDIKYNARALRRLSRACERAKKALSTATVTPILIDCLYGNLDFTYKLSRTQFEELNKDLFLLCIKLTDQCLKDAKVDKSDVDIVVLSGGSSRIPKMQELLDEYFGDKKVHRDINPDEAVAMGAAIQAAKLRGQGSNMINNVVLTDVTPLSLGVDMAGDVMSVVIPRNTPIPTKKMKDFCTILDNQTSISQLVYEGDGMYLGLILLLEARDISMCALKLMLMGCISGTSQDSGQMSKTTITYEESWLRKEEIQKMIKDAEKSKSEDKEHGKKYDVWVKLDDYTINMRKTMRNKELVSLISV